MRIPFIKTRQEREMERRLKYRRILRGLQSHLNRLQQMRERFGAMLRTAVATGNEVATQRNARAYASLGKRIERVQAQVLAVEGIEAVGQMVTIDRSFAEFAREMGRAMADAFTGADLARFQEDLEKGLMHAEEMDAMLDDIVGSLSENLVGFGAPAEDAEMEQAISDIAAEAKDREQQDEGLEERIAEELAAIREAMGKGA